jgi:hypothetical protein
MNANSFPTRSKGWNPGSGFTAPSAQYGPGASFHEGFASLKAADWSKSSNSGNSFFTQGRVDTQVTLVPFESKDTADWHLHLYRQYVFQFADPQQRLETEFIGRLKEDEMLLQTNTDSMDEDKKIYGISNHWGKQLDFNSPFTTVVTSQQINYILAKNAEKGIDLTFDKIMEYFTPLGVCITPDSTMKAYSGEDQMHIVIQRSGLTDVYNMWKNPELGYPVKGDNLYFIVKPMDSRKHNKLNFGVKLGFTEDKKDHVELKQGSSPVVWQFHPYFTNTGIDPPVREYMEVINNRIFIGGFIHAGRVDQVLFVNNMHMDENLDKNDNLTNDVVQVIRSAIGIVINLTARRNIPISV